MDIAIDGDGPSGHTTPTRRQANRVWLRIGLLSFGGPAAQIALMHREIVDQKKWLSEQQYLNALSFCMLLPGPEAMQLATYAGWRLHGSIGGLIAGLFFVLPGALVILALALVYGLMGDVSLVNALFLGVKAAVVVIVIEALLKVSRRALKLAEHWVIAGLAFVGIFFFAVPFPLIILGAGVFGFFRAGATDESTAPVRVTASARSSLGTALLWLLIWIAPAILLLAFDDEGLLLAIGVFFSKLAVVTFGGAYAVLAYLGQDVVSQFGWLTAGEMMDGLGLAETTPGPLILVNEFVGFLAAYRHAGIGYGLLGALTTLWATFVPCFLWIFVGAPYIDWIGSQFRLRRALSAITAAVVGVILNLSLWFALHIYFTQVTAQKYGPLILWQPELTTFDWPVLVLSTICALLLLRCRLGVSSVLLVAALSGMAWSVIAV